MGVGGSAKRIDLNRLPALIEAMNLGIAVALSVGELRQQPQVAPRLYGVHKGVVEARAVPLVDPCFSAVGVHANRQRVVSVRGRFHPAHQKQTAIGKAHGAIEVGVQFALWGHIHIPPHFAHLRRRQRRDVECQSQWVSAVRIVLPPYCGVKSGRCPQAFVRARLGTPCAL